MTEKKNTLHKRKKVISVVLLLCLFTSGVSKPICSTEWILFFSIQASARVRERDCSFLLETCLFDVNG